jgi:hypothetical protein
MIAVVGTIAVTACASRVAPDAPRPVRDTSGLSQPATGTGGQQPQSATVELRSLQLRLVRGDTMLTRLAGAALLARAPAAVAVEVTTVNPLGDVARSASLEIYLDTLRIPDTWPLPPDRLIGFLADGQQLRAGMQVTVAWHGSEDRTRSRQPLIVTDDHLRAIR